MSSARTPLDVWLRIEDDQDEAEAEANTFHTAENEFCVEWYLNSVGLVTRKWFATYEAAAAWLESEGFQDFSS